MDFNMEDNLNMPLGEVLRIIQDRIMSQSTYFGIRTLMSPLDFWVYQEIIFETKPDVIIEIGNLNGGSALSLAHICELLGHGRVIGVDISHENVSENVKNHQRITFVTGDACEKFQEVEKLISKDESVLIVEDSSHTYENTLNILRTYSKLTKPGAYLIVEDSICHHGLAEGPKFGPYEAVEQFVMENSDFEIDRSKESFLITWNPKGYLKRIKFEESNAPLISCKPSPSNAKSSMREVLKLIIPPIFLLMIKSLKRYR